MNSNQAILSRSLLQPASLANNNEFSVLMSLYHKENPHYLDKCFESLLNQTLPAAEIVVVFDGPLPPDLLDVVDRWCRRLPIKSVPLAKNVGLGRALAKGLEACHYDLVARMDTDDLCAVTRFEAQIRFMAAHPEVALCGSCIVEIEPDTELEQGVRNVPLSHEQIKARLPTRNPFNHMTVVFRKTAVLAVGNYQDFPLMEDWYLWARLIKAGYRCANLPECLVKARTGTGMVLRRGGAGYVKSEYLITRFFIQNKLTPWWKGWLVFLARSVPRLVPTSVRRKIYQLLRG